MPFLFHKLLPLGVLPIGFTLVMLVLAFVFRKRWIIAAAAVVLYVFSTEATGEGLIRTLENRFPKQQIESCPETDAIVVLGGVLRERQDGIEWTDAVDRFDQAVALFQAGKAPRIIFTGARLPWYDEKVTEGDELRRAAIDRGVPPGAVTVTSEVATTEDEAAAVTDLAKQQRWSSILLVTSAFHMTRAVRLFRNIVPTIIPFPVDYRARTGVRYNITDFIPKADALLISEIALREYWGLAYYAFRR